MNSGAKYWKEGDIQMGEIIKRSIGQVVYKHTPGSFIAIDEGIYGVVDQIIGKRDMDVDINILFKNIHRFVEKWKEESNGKVRGFDYHDKDSFLPIRPSEGVIWNLFSVTLECQNKKCKIIIDPNSQGFNGKCFRCRSGLRQFRYVWFHTCGSVYPIFILKGKSCPQHERKYLYLEDTGRFKFSYWKCRECNYTSPIGMLPCVDNLCISKRQSQGKVEAHQGSVWNDPWVYFPQQVNFVNLKDDQINPIIESDIKNQLILSSYLGTTQTGQGSLKAKARANQLSSICENEECRKAIPTGSLFCNWCATKQTLVSTIADKENIAEDFPNDLFDEDSDLTIFSAVRDLERSVSLVDKKLESEKKEDVEAYSYFNNALSEFNAIGVFDALLIGDFPLTTAAIGYSRFQSKPPMWLRAFKPINNNDTRIPVYTYCTTTEAWMIQLSARYILKWLIANKIISEVDIEKTKNMNETEAKLWLIKRLHEDSINNPNNNLYNIVCVLIHTYSHTLLHSLATESGSDIASCGELLLPNALSFIVYVGETDIGGLTASFNQGLSSILENVSEQVRVCKFDPSCTDDDDSACVGCIYLPRGCVEFNEKLSRTYLFGGKNKKMDVNDIQIGFFDLKE